MFKRLFWLCVGIGFGAGAAIIFSRWIKEAKEKYQPDAVTSRFTDTIRGAVSDLTAAIDEGRQAMAEKEIEIRESLENN